MVVCNQPLASGFLPNGGVPPVLIYFRPVLELGIEMDCGARDSDLAPLPYHKVIMNRDPTAVRHHVIEEGFLDPVRIFLPTHILEGSEIVEDKPGFLRVEGSSLGRLLGFPSLAQISV